MNLLSSLSLPSYQSATSASPVSLLSLPPPPYFEKREREYSDTERPATTSLLLNPNTAGTIERYKHTGHNGLTLPLLNYKHTYNLLISDTTTSDGQ